MLPSLAPKQLAPEDTADTDSVHKFAVTVKLQVIVLPEESSAI